MLPLPYCLRLVWVITTVGFFNIYDCSSRTCDFTSHDVSLKPKLPMKFRQWASHRYVILRVGHASGMPGTFSPPPWGSDPNMQHGTCATHVPWCMPGSLTSGVLWSRWWGKRSRHSRRKRNPQFYVSGKRPMEYGSSLPCQSCLFGR